MNPSDALNDDERFALLIARYSEVINEGGEVDPSADPSLSPQLKERLERALRLVHHLHRSLRSSAASDSGVIKGDVTLHDSILGGQVGRFRIERLLGHGGGGIVFLAFDPELRREVALKIPHLPALLTPDLGRRFLREARAAAQLDHPNLVPIYEVAEANGVCFLVSAYCRGGSLAQWLAARTTPVPVRQVATWLATLADAVQYVHQHGIYHRDIKPGNILLDPRLDSTSGEQAFVPRLSDFGLAKLHDPLTEATRSGTMLGTVSYMAPEQVEGCSRGIGPSTDVYALGAVLYEMLTGQPPFSGVTDTDTLRQVLADEPAPPRRLRPDVPPDLQTICLKCLEKEPERRYASAAELAADLRRFLAHEPIQARPLGRSGRLRKWTRRHPTKTILCASGLILVLFLVIGWFQLESLQRARDADREAVTEQGKEQQKAIRVREQRLRYGADIAQAWHFWENRRLDEMANRLNKYCPSAGLDDAEDVRGFEWYYLSRLERTRPRRMHYPASLYSIAFSPDGATCASGHANGTIVLWDVASGQQLELLKEHKLDVYALAYSPDGNYLASGSGNTNHQGEFLLWDIRTRRVLRVLPAPPGAINSVAFSPDGLRLAAAICPGRLSGEVLFWEIPSGTIRNRIQFPNREVISVAFSSDGARVAIGRFGGTPLCDPVTGEILDTREWHPGLWYTVACGHKHAFYISVGRCGAEDLHVRLVPFRSGDPLVADFVPDSPVWDGALSPDDRTVACIYRDGLVKLWDRESKSECLSFKLPPGLGRAVSFSPDGTTFAAANENGDLWLREMNHTAETLSWLGHREDEKPCEAWAVAFSPDGKILASAGDDHRIRLWDSTTGRELAILDGKGSLVTSLSFSPNGKLLASGSFDKKAPVKLWDVESRKEIATLNGHNKPVDSVMFSPDGKILASAGRDRVVRLWDVATRKDLPILTGYSIESMAFSPDGRTLGLASDDRLLFSWDVTEKQMRQILPPHLPRHVALAFSPDGKTVVTGDSEGSVRFFDAATGDLRFSSVRSHSDVVNCLAFTPDGKTLASAGFDKKVKLWQVSTGRELLTLPEQKDRVRWLAFSPDGAMLATASHDGVLKIYRADSAHVAQPSKSSGLPK